MLEGLLGYETVTSYNREDWEVNRYDKSLGAYQNAALKSQVCMLKLYYYYYDYYHYYYYYQNAALKSQVCMPKLSSHVYV